MIVARVSDPRITTRANRADPLTVGESREPQSPAPTWAWVAFGLLLLLACGLWALGHPWWALSALAAASVPGLLILAVETGIMRDGGVPLISGRKLGKAPYQKTSAMKSPSFVNHIYQTIERGTTVARQKNWPLDWAAIDKLTQASDANRRSAEPLTALTPMLRILGELAEVCRTCARNAESKS
jgi:predicted membrane metal-binding protein